MNQAQKAVILILLAVCTAGCGNSRLVDAETCLLIDIRKDDDSALVPDLEAFARANSLVVDRNLPIPSLFTLNGGGKKLAVITYSVGKRETGSELALFRFDVPGSEKLAASLGEFVETKIKPKYATYRCADVPGYAPPKASP